MITAREPHLAGPAIRLAVLNATLARMREPCAVCQRARSLPIQRAMEERVRWVLGHDVLSIAKRLDQRPETIRLLIWGKGYTSPALGEEALFVKVVDACQAAVDATRAPWSDEPGEPGAWADSLKDFMARVWSL